MQKYRKSSHTVYDIKYHLVWVTKYRKEVLSVEFEEFFFDYEDFIKQAI